MNPFGENPHPSWTLADVRAALRRRARVAIIAFGALAAGAVAAVLTAPAIYEGDFKILVKRDRADAVVTGADADALRPGVLSEHELYSEVELLKATDLLQQVADEAGLVARMREDAATDLEARARALQALQENLTISPIRNTWLIDVGFRDRDPQVTRAVLETLVQRYLDRHVELQGPAGTYDFFARQAQHARQELADAQQALSAFTREHGVVSATAEQQAALEKLAEFDALQAQTAAALAETTGRMAATRSALERVPAQRTSEVRIVPSAGVIEDVQARILTLEMQRTELLGRFTPEYKGVVDVERQLRDARAALQQALETPAREETIADNPTRQWLETELARTNTESAALEARLQALSSAVGEYRQRAQLLEVRGAEQDDLIRRVAAAEERFRLYTMKQEEARIADALDETRIANVAIAQAPTLRLQPTRQPSLAMLPLLLGVALLLSVALALMADGLSAPARAALPEPLDETRAATALSMVSTVSAARTWSLTARIEELRALTEEVQAQLAPQLDRSTGPARETTGWMPAPHTEGVRQGA